MNSGSGRNCATALILLLLVCLTARDVLAATDFADPGDTMLFLHNRNRTSKPNTGHSTLPELDGTIEAISTAKPGWYCIALKLDSEKPLKVFVVPATKFFKDYAPLPSAEGYPLLVKGCKIRALHDPEKDEALRNITLTDLMFETPPVEFAGTIKVSASTVPGVYDLTVNLKDGGERHLNLDPKTKYWKDNKPIDLAAAYPQLVPGQMIRALEKPAPGGRRWTSDLMFVDRW